VARDEHDSAERQGYQGRGPWRLGFPYINGSPREARSNKSGSIIVKVSEELLHLCELEQASTCLPPTSAQVLGERREQTL
jgi:hypothetical protein